VNIASVPDGAGEAHFRLSWPAAPGAKGYVIYAGTETKILAECGADQPALNAPLAARLAEVRTRFAANPTRRAFTRLKAELVNETSLDIALPRGTGDIHFFTALGVSGGEVEGPWPTSPDAIIPVAAPKIVTPPPPILLARERGGAVAISIEGRGGQPALERFELYRVRNAAAARDVDTMGPPCMALDSATAAPDWTIAPAAPAAIESATGIDRPPGSWLPYHYRAIAWAKSNPAEAIRGGRSKASPAMAVLIPPSDPPNLSAPTASQPALDPAEILFEWTSTAPARETPLGSHHLYVRAAAPGSPDLVAYETVLEATPTAEPASGVKLWRTPGPSPSAASLYRLLVQRAAATDPLDLTVRLRDPLGRVSERMLHIAPGSVEPAPDIAALTRSYVSGTFSDISFTSHAPVIVRPFGAYRLTVLAQRRRVGLWGFLLPLAPLTLDMALPDIPEGATAPVPPATAMRIVRATPPVGATTFRVRCPARVTRVRVTITAPDGRSVTAEA
jgi:hypothetical protein